MYKRQNYTFGTVNLSGKKLTMGGNGGLTLPNALNMSAGSKIETKTSDLTLSSALQLGTGSITSTGGTISLDGGATLSNSGQLDVSGTNLKVKQALNLSGGTFTSNTSSVLDLQTAATLTSSSPVSFKKVNLNNKVLTLGSAGTHLKLTDSNETLSLNNLALETGAGSLTLAGPLSLSGSGQLNSTAGTITLSSGGSAASGATVSIPGSTLVLQSGLSLSGSTLKASSTTFTTNNNTISLNGSILEVQGTQDLSGVVPDNTSTLRLGANATINDSSVLSVGTLDLANFALTLNNQMAGLNVKQAVTLDAATEQIVSGNADLSLSGGITVSNGILSSTGGTLSASSFSAGAAAKVNILGGTLILPAGGTAVSGAAITTSNAAVSLAGTLAVADTLTSTNTNLSLTCLLYTSDAADE